MHILEYACYEATCVPYLTNDTIITSHTSHPVTGPPGTLDMTPDPRNASLPETAGNRESWVYVCTRQSSERHTGFPWPPHKPSWEPVKRQWETDGNTPWESFSSPSIAFPGGPGWLELSESLLTPFSPRLSGKGWVGKLMQWPAAGVRGHDDDTHCCKTWTLLTLAFCRLVCVSCPDWGDS